MGRAAIGGFEDSRVIVDLAQGVGQAHRPHAYYAAYSPDGKRIVSGGADGILRLWDAGTGKQLRQFEGHIAPVYDVTFFPDGKRIASASEDRSAMLRPRCCHDCG